MNTKLLFFDFEFTSLSPDAQPISLGVVSDCGKSLYCEFTDFDINRCDDWVKENVVGKLKYHNYEYPKIMPDNIVANIIDFKDMGRGTIFQHEQTNETDLRVFHDSSPELFGNTTFVKTVLKEWLKQFSDYQIQFVADCGTFDWYHLLQLVAEWDDNGKPIGEITGIIEDENNGYLKDGYSQFIGYDSWGRLCQRVTRRGEKINEEWTLVDDEEEDINKIGPPKLPSNISPVPLDLNDLIAFKKGISVKEAFELDREELAFGVERMDADSVGENIKPFVDSFNSYLGETNGKRIEFAKYMIGQTFDEHNVKHNSLWDAKVIKSIYNKLI